MLPLFAEVQSVGLGVDRNLFSQFLESEEFQRWQRGDCGWQLRCIGRPGAGKTTLSAVIVNHLKHAPRSEKADVAGVYFKRPIGPGEDAVSALLCSIQRQLSSDDLNVRTSSSISNSRSLEEIRSALSDRLQQNPRGFLVIDDFDLCGLEAVGVLEAELEKLQGQGLSILVTSRIAREYNLEGVKCDAALDDPVHVSQDITLHWECATCRAEGRVDDDDPVDICSMHVNDYVCERCGPRTNMVEPYKHVDVIFSMDSKVLRDFIATELESNHGDLELNSSCHPKPLRSKLGRSLMESRIPHSTQRLLDRIIDQANGNITIAKLRLEDIERARSVDDLWHVGDRLPDNVVALYNASLDSLQKSPEPYRTLGVKALVGVAATPAGKPFDELQRWLRKEAGLDSPATTDTPSYTLEEVMHAAAGFLYCSPWLDIVKPNIVEFYNPALHYYIREDYNEFLYWTKISMPSGKLSRSSSMKFGALSISTLAASPKFRTQPRGSGVIMSGAPTPMNFKRDKWTRIAPKRQISEPGRINAERQGGADQPVFRRTDTWL